MFPHSHLKTGYLGVRALTVMHEEITHHIFTRGKRLKRQINRLLMEQAFSGFLHKGAIV